MASPRSTSPGTPAGGAGQPAGARPQRGGGLRRRRRLGTGGLEEDLEDERRGDEGPVSFRSEGDFTPREELQRDETGLAP